MIELLAESTGQIADEVDFGAFMQGIEMIHRNVRLQDFNLYDYQDTPQQVGMSIWLIDGKTAFFSIPMLNVDNPTENGFITSDSRLINGFRSLVTRHKLEAADPDVASVERTSKAAK